MRLIAALPLIACAVIGGCATPRPRIAGCAPPTAEQYANIIFPTVDKAFGHQKLGYRARVESVQPDGRRRLVVQLRDIIPYAEEEEPGGARFTIVLDACRHTVLKAYRPV
jgi:hypothetical protein